MAMAIDEIGQIVTACPGGVHLAVKVVPGASRSRIVGVLGDRLKVAVSAPPEAGKANRAVCDLLARAFDVPAGDVSVISGTSKPRKVIEVLGPTACAAVAVLRAALGLVG